MDLAVNKFDNADIIASRQRRVNEFSFMCSMAALEGYSLKRVRTGYTLSRRNFLRHFTDIEAVRELLITGGE